MTSVLKLNNQTNRITEIDIAKGIGIILVVYAHIVLAEPLLTVIYSFHMPLFFILSGMVTKVYKYESLGKLLKNRTRTMILPYLFFCFLGILMVTVIDGSRVILKHQAWEGAGEFFRHALISVFWAPYSLKYFTEFNTPLWFVPCLLLVEVMYFAIHRLCKGKKPLVLLTVAIITVLGWVMEYPTWSDTFAVLPFNFSSACFSLGFFAIGESVFPLLRSGLLSGDNRKKELFISLCGLLAGGAATVALALVNGKVSIGSRILNNGFLFYITGITGTLVVICLARLLNKSKFLLFMGKNSFTVMGVHILFYNCVPHFASAAGKVGLGFIIDAIKSYGKTAWQIFGFAVSFVLSIIFVLLYNFVLTKRRIKNGRTA